MVLGVLSATRRETADLPMVVSGSGGGGPGLIARATTEEQKVRELATELKRERVLRFFLYLSFCRATVCELKISIPILNTLQARR